jgi:hypothetical protein
MKKRGSGQIVNIGSIFGSIPFAYFVSYSSAKAGLKALSEALRRELDGTGVTVTYVAPRAVKTPMNHGKVVELSKATRMAMDAPEAVAARIAGIAGLSSAVTMEVDTLDDASMGAASMDAASMGDASTGSAQGPVEAHAPLSATEAIDVAIESVTPIDAAPGYVARFADEEPLAAPVRALPVDHSEDDVLTAPLDVPRIEVPHIEVPSSDVPQIDVPEVDAAERPVPRQDALPRRASDDIPRADALDDE